jgi:hypothetical protein
MKMTDQKQTNTDEARSFQKRWGKWLVVFGLGILCLGYLILAEHLPYPRKFNMEWDEEVEVAKNDVIWVHRIATYLRRSSWSRWDARKVAEELSFEPSARIGKISYHIDHGGFGGVERMEDNWVIAFAGSELSSLRIGSCASKGNGMCLLVIKADGTTYKPSNANEVIDNFKPWFRCRTTTEDCYQRFHEKKLSISLKEAYARTNPQPIDFEVGIHNGRRYPSTEFTTP